MKKVKIKASSPVYKFKADAVLHYMRQLRDAIDDLNYSDSELLAEMEIDGLYDELIASLPNAARVVEG